MAISLIVVAVTRQVIAVGAEVVVDHIENDPQAPLKGGVDKTFQRVRVSIDMGGRKESHAIVAPIPTAGKLRQRHQLDHGDTASLQFIELVDSSIERPF